MIVSGKDLAARLKAEMAAEVATFPEKYGRVPHLVVILVGENPASVSYVTGKAKASEVVGIKNTTIRKPDTISEEELLGLIRQLAGVCAAHWRLAGTGGAGRRGRRGLCCAVRPVVADYKEPPYPWRAEKIGQGR